MWRGKIYSGSRLWNVELATDLTKKVTRLEVSVHFLHGTYDHAVSYPLATSYYEQLDAPLKGFNTFAKSGAQPLVRGVEENARGNAGGCTGRRKRARRPGVRGTTGWAEAAEEEWWKKTGDSRTGSSWSRSPGRG
jgi:hypothetical protein